MAQLCPIVIFAIATVALAYLFSVIGLVLTTVLGAFGGFPDWIWTAVLGAMLVATFRLLRC